jgi:hypothetical protein
MFPLTELEDDEEDANSSIHALPKAKAPMLLTWPAGTTPK